MTRAVLKPSAESLDELLARLSGCRVCAKHLPLGPRPVLQVVPSARILILSQAPGTRVHETGLNFNDRSGDRLREWMGVDRDTFYDDRCVAVMGMAFCYPGRDAKGGDLPPRPECAPLWHPDLLAHLPKVALTLLVGSYAIEYYMPDVKRQSMTETVKAWRLAPAGILPLPHPSWRTTFWEKQNPWFRRTLIPELRRRVAALL
ncbi:MAG: uracil-DNA glycosylase family protein [Alphaproteobacteria bacterium]|nr:uracil-DNA glycosylase family protein [Alphaproteobacteria bacterium]